MSDRIQDILTFLNQQAATSLKKLQSDNNENESVDTELKEYKQEFLEMSIAALKNIVQKINAILDNSDLDRVKENLTEPWLQGMIAVVEDNVSAIHDFVKFTDSTDDNSSEGADRKRPGLWENIRKKKEREGKDYKPAKPGDKDRPNPDQWKKLTKSKVCSECGQPLDQCDCN